MDEVLQFYMIWKIRPKVRIPPIVQSESIEEKKTLLQQSEKKHKKPSQIATLFAAWRSFTLTIVRPSFVKQIGLIFSCKKVKFPFQADTLWQRI